MPNPRTALAALLLLFLVACAGGSTSTSELLEGQPSGHSQQVIVGQASSVVIHQSPNDSRQYRFVTLENSLRVLLISDPQTDKAAASLSVGVGSFENPDDRPGLAHFLEHMLFLGTQKYPDPGAYQAFISEHGGSHNAYTSSEETNYFFDIDADFLLPVLDRFSQFFVAPLFNQDYVDREQHAVESEYRLRIKEDNYREWDILRELASSAHPLSKFSVGNLDTLANRPGDAVRDDLVDFYQRYYSANLMNLVVLGRESLEVLEQAVVDRFAAVPNHDVSIADRQIPLFSQDLPMLVQIKPVQEKRELSFLFPLPSDRKYWRTKPLEYLGHLLGHEAEGTLLMSLKARGLAERLSAGAVYDSRAGAAFGITIALTPEGARQTARIESQVFAWLDLVRHHGIAAWRYQELARLGEIAFANLEKREPVSYVRRLSTSLHDVPVGEVLRAPTAFYQFDAAVIDSFADYLNPNNVLVSLVAPEVEGDRRSALYDAPYRIVPVTAAERRRWAEARADDLRLPAANPYIPDNLAVHPGGARMIPAKIREIEGNSLWFYQDGLFSTPKALFSVRIATPEAGSVRGQAMTDLYLALVNDQLVPEVYPAHLAGLGFSLSQWENGVSFSLEGYSEKQPVMLGTVLATMKNPDWNPERFQRVKSALLREWRNTASDSPMRQIFSQFRPLLRDISHPLQRADALDSVSLPEIREFAGRLFARGHGRFYAGGNLTPTQAQAMMRATLVQLKIGARGDEAVEYLVRKLAPGDLEYFLAVDHTDAATALYIQGGEDSLRERARLALLQMVTSAPFYHELRTEKQLGYQVGNTIAHFNRVPGLIFYLQSPVASSQRLRAEVDAFLDKFSEQVASMTRADLERIKASVLAGIEETPKNLSELAFRHLEALDLDFEAIDFRSQLAAEVANIGLDELQRAFVGLQPGQRRALWVMSVPMASGMGGEGIARRGASGLPEASGAPETALGGTGTAASASLDKDDVFRYRQ